MSDEVKSKFDMFEVDEETGEVLVSEDMMEKALINPDEVLEALEEAFKEPEEGDEPKTVSALVREKHIWVKILLMKKNINGG